MPCSAGTLDLDEIKQALRTLQEASAQAEKDVVRLKKSTAEMAKATRLAQAEFKRTLRNDEAEAAMRVEAAAREEHERALAAQRAKEEARREKEARMAVEAAEKAAFEAKIRDRRKEAKVEAAKVEAARASSPTGLSA